MFHPRGCGGDGTDKVIRSVGAPSLLAREGFGWFELLGHTDIVRRGGQHNTSVSASLGKRCVP